MNPRSDPSASASSHAPAAGGVARRLRPWIVVAVLVATGVVLALRYGTRVTPLLDGIR